MRINVLYFAALRERAGRSETSEEVPSGTTAGALWQRLRAQPPLDGGPSAVGFAVNGQWCGPDRELADGDTLALLPPVSGG